MSYILKTNYADKSNYGSYRSLSKIKYIVWHYTANDEEYAEAKAQREEWRKRINELEASLEGE